ncbi:MAG: OmpH family outer membrane protein [Prevotella sp.]|nr:OmpH family outer membrane protein [Prevotella sp.]
MKRIVLLIFVMAALTASAQTDSTGGADFNGARVFTFGYLSYEAALKSMPEYAEVQQQMKALQEQYQAETLRVEDEFNRKYEDFLDGQRDFPRTILQKRQTELQELMEKNIQFKEQGRQELAEAERQAMAPLRIRLIETLSKIGREKGYAFIYDTDTKALPFINPAQGDDINQFVISLLQNE